MEVFRDRDPSYLAFRHPRIRPGSWSTSSERQGRGGAPAARAASSISSRFISCATHSRRDLDRDRDPAPRQLRRPGDEALPPLRRQPATRARAACTYHIAPQDVISPNESRSSRYETTTPHGEIQLTTTSIRPTERQWLRALGLCAADRTRADLRPIQHLTRDIPHPKSHANSDERSVSPPLIFIGRPTIRKSPPGTSTTSVDRSSRPALLLRHTSSRAAARTC
jgi:hypothetical protein